MNKDFTQFKNEAEKEIIELFDEHEMWRNEFTESEAEATESFLSRKINEALELEESPPNKQGRR